MNIEKIIASTEKTLNTADISLDNLIKAVIKLLEIAHANNLDSDAVKALSECGIILEIEEE